MNTNKLHLFYAPITQKDDLIVKRKESYCNNEIREHIQAPEVTSLLLLMHTLGGDQTPTGRVCWKLFQLFSHLNVPTFLDLLVIIWLTFMMYYEIYYQNPNGFNMACYTQNIYERKLLCYVFLPWILFVNDNFFLMMKAS